MHVYNHRVMECVGCFLPGMCQRFFLPPTWAQVGKELGAGLEQGEPGELRDRGWNGAGPALQTRLPPPAQPPALIQDPFPRFFPGVLSKFPAGSGAWQSAPHSWLTVPTPRLQTRLVPGRAGSQHREFCSASLFPPAGSCPRPGPPGDTGGDACSVLAPRWKEGGDSPLSRCPGKQRWDVGNAGG